MCFFAWFFGVIASLLYCVVAGGMITGGVSIEMLFNFQGFCNFCIHDRGSFALRTKVLSGRGQK